MKVKKMVCLLLTAVMVVSTAVISVAEPIPESEQEVIVLDETEQLSDEEVSECVDETDEAEEIIETEETDEAEEIIEAEETDEAEEIIEAENANAAEEISEVEEIDDTEEILEIESVEIPKEDEEEVVESATYTLSGDTLTVTGSGVADSLPNNIESNKANIKKIVIGNGITQVGDNLFDNFTALESVSFPSTMTRYGHYSFGKCVSLTSVTIVGNGATIGDYAFQDCTSLSSVVIKKGVTKINYSAFYRCSALQSVVIEEGLTTIDSCAFEDCTALSKIVIPKSVTSIGNHAFSGDRLLNTMGDGSSYDIQVKRIYGVNGNARFPYVTEVVIPSGVKQIPQYSFYECKDLQKVTFHSNITSYGKQSFQGCDSLTSLTIPGNGATVEDYAFYKCTSLGTVNICKGVKTVKYSAFSGCSALRTLTLGDGLTTLENASFENCDSLSKVDFPKSISSIGYSAFENCNPGVKFYCYSGTAATEYAKTNKLACYLKNPSYTIKFNKNGGSGSMKSQTIKFSKSTALNNKKFKRSGYTFVGWDTKKDGTGTRFKNKSKINLSNKRYSNKVTLYAQWKPKSYKVVYDKNYSWATGSMGSESGIKYGSKYKLAKNKFKVSGARFAGWNTKKDGTGKQYRNGERIKMNMLNKNKLVLYAQWKY